jgi:cytidylate kinase
VSAEEISRVVDLIARLVTRVLRETNVRSLRPTARPRRLPAGPSSANFVLSCATSGGPVVVKVRVDPDDRALEEASALGRLSDSIVPRVRAHIDLRQARQLAFERGDALALRDLEPDVGGVIVLDRVPGRAPKALTDVVAEALVPQLIALHSSGKRGWPKRDALADARALLSDAQVLIDDLRSSPHIPSSLRRDVARGLSRARVEARANQLVVCHGDLRLHNVAIQGASARLLDLEHAARGDAAIDLALFIARASLDESDSYYLLERYAEAGAGFADTVDRALALVPVARLAGAASALVDLDAVASGARPTTVGADVWLQANGPRLIEEAARAVSSRPNKTVATQQGRVRGQTKPGRARGTIAVDGTACSGKSGVARALAAQLSVPYFSTGAAYRFAARLALEAGLRPDRPGDVDKIVAALRRSRARLVDGGAIRSGGVQLSGSLALAAVEDSVAQWAELADVREALSRVLAPAFAGPAVVEGRDVGTALCPDAQTKLFIDADLAVRARRLLVRLPAQSEAKARKRLQARDKRDRRRAVAPMTPAKDALHLDTSKGSRAQIVARALRAVAQ